MKVNITYFDNDSFTMEEVVKQAVHNYGKSAVVNVGPETSLAYDHIYFGLQQLITHEQLSMFFAKDGSYQKDLQGLRERVLYKVTEIVDQVIVDNEAKVA